MKFKFLFVGLILMSGVYVHAEEPEIIDEPMYGSEVVAATTGTTDRVPLGGEADYNESCICRCTAQGVLLRECDGATENLGNYGNVSNCNIEKEEHPQCN